MEPDTAKVIEHCETNLRVCGHEVTEAITQVILKVNQLGKANDNNRTVFTQDIVSSLTDVVRTLNAKRRECEDEIVRQQQFVRIDEIRRQYEGQIEKLSLRSSRVNDELKKMEASMASLNKWEQDIRRRPASELKKEARRRLFIDESFSVDLNDE